MYLLCFAYPFPGLKYLIFMVMDGASHRQPLTKTDWPYKYLYPYNFNGSLNFPSNLFVIKCKNLVFH